MPSIELSTPASEAVPGGRVDGVDPPAPGTATGRRRAALEVAVLAVLAFVPMLASQPGAVTDDTKTYLYLDPGRYVRQAVSLWDPNVALGTVTHENIGYLLPMGPFYWALAELHVPLWIAQRLWMGTLLFAAGAGMLYLCRTIGLRAPGSYVASLAFMFAPYVMQYSGRISVILMPWSGLPWMTAFVILALRRGGWRYPALFALVVALVSGINASSILYVGIGPALWLPFAVLVLHEATGRQAWRVAWKVGLLSALVSLWWAIGLQVEAAYGVNILKYTETLTSTSATSSPAEVLRGLGYWFFYGASDQTGNWTQTAVAYTQQLWLVALSVLVPALAFVGAALVKWRQRSYWVLLVVVGTIAAVGPYPYANGTTVSSFLKAFMSDTTAGLALRSTDRASPLLLLGLAVLLGSGITAVTRRASRGGLVVAALAVAAIAGASVPLWTGGTVVNGLTQPDRPPGYVLQAATALDKTHPGLRVYALPGNNFGAYRWGDTIDTVYPALLTRPFVTHEQQTMGSLPTADLLEAVDTPLQDGVLDPATVAPMASLMSAGDILVQYDQQYERYDAPAPQQLAAEFAGTPPGLSHPVSYGVPRPNVSPVSHLDQQTLARPANPGWPAPLVSYTVADPRPVNRAESMKQPLVLAGNASGVVDASGVGLLATDPTIFYSGTLDLEPSLQKKVLSGSADLVVTDTNRKQGYRWNGIIDNAGYTESRSERPDRVDPTDAPLDLFRSASPDSQSMTVYNNIKAVTASSYGSLALYYPWQRAAAAIDGSTATGWVTAEFPVGQWWQAQFKRPVTEHSVNLVASGSSHVGERITKVTLTFDQKDPVTVNLGPVSRTAAGQTITFPSRTFSTLRITIDAGKLSKNHYKAGFQNTAGFAEVRIPGVTADETVSMPRDLLAAAGPSSIHDPLDLVMTRERSSGFPPQQDTELTLARSFLLPTARTFSLTGQARISPAAPDATIDGVVGRSGGSAASAAGAPSVVASTSSRMAGDVRAGADAAIDGNPVTAWQPDFTIDQAGQWVRYQLSAPISFGTMDLKVVADGRHSVPTAITVSADGTSERVPLPPIADGKVPGSVTDVPVTLAHPLSGSDIRVTVDATRLENTRNYYTQSPSALPVGIAELGIPGLAAAPVPAAIPAPCRNDLLTVDGSPVWVSVSGSSTAALARSGLRVSLCGPDAAGVALGPGTHTLDSTWGQLSGIDMDRLALASAAGGGAVTLLADGSVPAPPASPVPTVRVVKQTDTSVQLDVSGVRSGSAPFALVMGQSINAGWKATAGGHDLGAPVLMDAYANGWQLDPAALGSSVHNGQVTVDLRWAPQQRVDIALIISGIAIVVCLILAFVPLRRLRRRRRGRHSTAPPAPLASSDPPTPSGDGSATVIIPAPDEEPVLVSSFRSEGGRSSVTTAVSMGFLVGLAAALISAPLIGLMVGVASAVALLVPRARLFLGVIAAGSIAAAAAYMTIRQGVKHFPPNGGWPSEYTFAGALVWVGLLFLAADATIEIVMRRVAPSAYERGPEAGAGDADAAPGPTGSV